MTAQERGDDAARPLRPQAAARSCCPCMAEAVQGLRRLLSRRADDKKGEMDPREEVPPTQLRVRFLTRWGRLQLGIIEMKSTSPLSKMLRERPVVDHIISAAAPCVAQLQLAVESDGTRKDSVLQPLGSLVRFLEKPGIADILKATNELSSQQFNQPRGALDEDTEAALRTWHGRVLPTLAGLLLLGDGLSSTSPARELATWSRTFLVAHPAKRAPPIFMTMPSLRRALSRSVTAAESFMSCESELSEDEVPPAGVEDELEHASDSDVEGGKYAFQSFATQPSLSSFAQAGSAFFSNIGLGGGGPSTWEFAKGSTEHGWDDTDATQISVRGPTYMSDKVKQPSLSSLCECVALDLFHSSVEGGCPNAGAYSGGVVSELRKAGETRFIFVVNFCMSPLHLTAAFAFKGSPAGGALPAANGDQSMELFRRFVEDMDDKERSQRFKVIPWVREGPWLVQKAVGRTPAIIGKSLKINYFSRPNDYFEVSIDIFSSAAAQRILGLLKGAARVLVMEVFFVLESKSEEECPERILGGFHVSHGDLSRTRGPI